MEARHLLKMLKDAGWYLGDAGEGIRQYVHKDRQEIVTINAKYGDELGAEAERTVLEHARLAR